MLRFTTSTTHQPWICCNSSAAQIWEVIDDQRPLKNLFNVRVITGPFKSLPPLVRVPPINQPHKTWECHALLPSLVRDNSYHTLSPRSTLSLLQDSTEWRQQTYQTQNVPCSWLVHVEVDHACRGLLNKMR